MARQRIKPPPKEPWHPIDLDKTDVLALRGLKAGTATPQQQQHAIQWLINVASRMDDLSFRPDSERATAFAEGKRFVGLQIWKALTLDMSTYFSNERKPNG